MIKIQKDNSVKIVSRKSFENFFKRLGYKEVIDTKHNKQNVVEETEQEVVEETKIYDGVPISDMTKEQLKEFCVDNNIDTSGAKNIREARKIVQETIKQRKM